MAEAESNKRRHGTKDSGEALALAQAATYVFLVKSYDDDDRPKDLLWSTENKTAHTTFAGALAAAKDIFEEKRECYPSADGADSDEATKLAAAVEYNGNSYDGEAMDFSHLVSSFSIVIYRMKLVD